MFFFQIPKLPEWLLSQNDYEGLADGLKKSTAEKGVFTKEEIAEYKKSWSEENALTSAINYYRANILNRLVGTQHKNFKISVPTLFIYGEQDHAILPETIKGIEEFIDAPYEELHVPESGHWVQQEAPQAVTDSIREFIKDN
jgi:pimeloyl-ACP methyl ester carboxylesterase